MMGAAFVVINHDSAKIDPGEWSVNDDSTLHIVAAWKYNDHYVLCSDVDIVVLNFNFFFRYSSYLSVAKEGWTDFLME